MYAKIEQIQYFGHVLESDEIVGLDWEADEARRVALRTQLGMIEQQQPYDKIGQVKQHKRKRHDKQHVVGLFLLFGKLVHWGRLVEWAARAAQIDELMLGPCGPFRYAQAPLTCHVEQTNAYTIAHSYDHNRYEHGDDYVDVCE